MAQLVPVLGSLAITIVSSFLLYIVLFYVLRSIFRTFENDAALVTLNVSAYPALIIFVLVGLKISFHFLENLEITAFLEKALNASIILVVGYWFSRLFIEVIAYYSKEYAQKTEVMWDDVLIPLLEAVVPVIVAIITGFLMLQAFGVDLTGIWVTLGGATFIIGFAVRDILANFFSGVVLLIDTPFQFGDILRLENGSTGLLKRIGVRVTHLYMLEGRCDSYIPNSVLQAEKISNLSRPTPHFHDSIMVKLRLKPGYDINETRKIMREIVLAHPDTLGEIDRKLECIDRFYDSSYDFEQTKEVGRLRLLAESEVNMKLEEVQQMLEVLAVTLQFAEKGGLTQDEIESIQQEYQGVLDLIGIKVITEQKKRKTLIDLEETEEPGSLIELIRDWYRAWLKDPNLSEQDQYLLPALWERNITILKRRVQRLFQKIANPLREETRLDDYVKELNKWLQQQLKETSGKWLEPKVLITSITHDESYSFIELTLSYYVDDTRLEDCERGNRVSSEIYQEIMHNFKDVAVKSISKDPGTA